MQPGPRRRSSVSGPFIGTARHETSTDQVNWTLFASRTDTTSLTSKVMDDVVTDHYWDRVNNGEMVVNDLSIIERTESCGGSIPSFNNSGTWTRISGDGSPSKYFRGLYPFSDDTLPPMPGYDTAVAQVKMQCLANIDKSFASFGEDVLEARETLRLIRHPIQSIVSDLYGPKPWRGIAAAWATYRFGWMPLIRSIDQALESFWTSRAKRPERRKATAKLVLQQQKAATKRVGANPFCDFSYSAEERRVVRAGCIYMSNNNMGTLSAELGFRSVDIPRTLWAVTPYSFMVDRVVDWSSAIAAFQNITDPSIKIVGGWGTLDLTTSNLWQLLQWGNSSGVSSGPGDIVKSSSRNRTRVAWAPSIFDAVPPYRGLDMLYKDATSVADLVSLITLRF